MTARLALVTGATSGIGLETARALAAQGARVVITSRDEAKGTRVAEALRRETGGEIEVLPCDFASLASIRAAAAAFLQRHGQLHVLVDNAGGMNPTRTLSADGYELTLAVNHLGYFLFTRLLLPTLKAAAPSRVVVVSSVTARFARIDFEDLQAERRYRALRQYAATKLMNLCFALELAERVRADGISVNALHPGTVSSGFGNVAGWFRIGYALARPWMLTAEQGARTSVHLASSPEVSQVTGGWFVRRKQRRPPRAALDTELRRRLWEVSERMCGLV